MKTAKSKEPSSLNEKQIRRFWSKVKKESPCWIWTGAKFYGGGYGCVNVNKRPMLAHRVAFVIHTKRSIPKGMCILHRCDNPSCVNPDHLFLGDQFDNMKDMISKGRKVCSSGNTHWTKLHPERTLKGEKHANAKFTVQDIIDIRRSYDSGKTTQRELASKYRTKHPVIGRIVRREAWSHVL